MTRIDQNEKTGCGALRQPYSPFFTIAFVRLTGIEPALREKPDPKSGASANSATGAIVAAKVCK